MPNCAERLCPLLKSPYARSHRKLQLVTGNQLPIAVHAPPQAKTVHAARRPFTEHAPSWSPSLDPFQRGGAIKGRAGAHRRGPMMTQYHRRPGQLAARSRPLPAVTVNAEPDTLQAKILVVAPTGTRGCGPCPQPEALDQSHQTQPGHPAASFPACTVRVT